MINWSKQIEHSRLWHLEQPWQSRTVCPKLSRSCGRWTTLRAHHRARWPKCGRRLAATRSCPTSRASPRTPRAATTSRALWTEIDRPRFSFVYSCTARLWSEHSRSQWASPRDSRWASLAQCRANSPGQLFRARAKWRLSSPRTRQCFCRTLAKCHLSWMRPIADKK